MGIEVLTFSLRDLKSVTISAAPAVTVAPLPGEGDHLMLVNLSAVVIYVQTGDSTVTASADAMPILPGEKGAYSKGQATTHIAAFVVAGTADLVVLQGSGV